METISRKQVLFGLGIIIAGALLFALIKFYDLGYRLSVSRGVTLPAEIVISPFTQGSELYLDGERVMEAEIDGDTVTLRTSAGPHEVATNRTNYSPWQKALDIDSGERVVVGPYNIPATTNGAVVATTDAEYRAARDLLAQAKVPTKESPIVSRDGKIEAYVDGQSLVARVKEGEPPQSFCAESCETEKQVVTLDAEVRGLSFLPGRNDVLLMAVQDGVFAIEIDTRGTQNFQVLYRGIRPTFAASPEGLIYLRDNDTIFKVFLFPANQ
jgi:hypothetical protein